MLISSVHLHRSGCTPSEEWDMTGLGAQNTVMQKINAVPRFLSDYQLVMKSDQADEYDDPWDYTKQSSDLFESEITWKKANIFQANVKDILLENDVPLIDSCNTYFNEHADILAVQAQERGRNLLKYLADLSGKLLPCRHLDQRGLCKKYPDLFLEFYKLTMPTVSDGIPQILLTDANLMRLNDTVEYKKHTDIYGGGV